MAWIDNSTLVGLRVFVMFGSWIALFGSYIYVEISGSHYWYNMFDVTILDLSDQYSNVIIIRVFLLILLASTTLSTLLTLSACEYAKAPRPTENPARDDINHALRLQRSRKLYIISAFLDLLNMTCCIVAFSMFTAHVLPAFKDKYYYVDHIHYGFGWGFSVLLFVFCLFSACIAFYLIFGIGCCSIYCPSIGPFARRGEHLSDGVSWENDDNNVNATEMTEPRFTIASPTSSGSGGMSTPPPQIGSSMSLEFEGSNEKKPTFGSTFAQPPVEKDEGDIL
ncbi:hypothetical protein TrLO_g13381 [Triparma laevis f. longispina]|uniref:Uncharacterized protein n=1 Tax=Triparma laevis f. longispina TaxID=1714387 RepID=A0A9W6ZW49_9STRA|nr:hypothetical protein TrLO_g13381 [Triparma laevis f. longispina]